MWLILRKQGFKGKERDRDGMKRRVGGEKREERVVIYLEKSRTCS